MFRCLLFVFAILPIAATPAAAAETADEDRYIGYYYPAPDSTETYVARATTLADSDSRRRIGFVVSLERELQKRPYAPEHTFFVKGGEAADKLIIVATRAGRLDTIYRVRALLASLTSAARTTPVFREYRVDDLFTFLDLLKLLGFQLLTVSDGDKFTHQVTIK